ncbi:integral membrane sensor signal transduction histidine kinase [Alicycliphilus sp. B1]|nr:integral membrane sensor signal transduction histidine kinase [Alicycliphilus sp. B1]
MNGLRRTAPWLLAWLVLAAAGCAWLARQRLQQLHDAFDTDARIAHRVLSQRMVQHEAILATLVLLQPEGPAAGPVPWSALARPYPQVREVLRHDDAAQAWPAGWPQGMDAALAQSRASGHAMLARSDLASGQLYLVQAGSPASFALHLDLHATASADDWPLPSGSPVRAWFTLGSQHYEIQGGAETAGRWHWHWRAEKTLAAASQPLALHMQQTVRADMLPWAAMLGWVAGSAALLACPAPADAPARGPPARRAAAAAGPGGAVEHPGGTRRRHGARAQPAAHGGACQQPGRAAPAGRR